MSGSAVRLFLVDDHALFREGLLRLLETDPHLEIVGNAATGSDALAQLSTLTVDVLILDYDLGTETALSLVRQLRNSKHPARILLVTAGLPNEDALELIRLGVCGIFHKQNSPDLLHRSIREVASGKVLIEQNYLQSLILSAKPGTDGTIKLTERDKTVLQQILEGLSNKEIASNLGISESAVKASIQQLFAKTGVRTRSQLVRVALEHLRPELLD
jgi:two-component system, NarL family, nitrate/nitrite response regulator NarL